MVAKEILNPAAVPVRDGLFAQSIAIDPTTCKRLLLISGQVACNAAGDVVGRGDFRMQFTQVYANLAAVLDAGNCTMGDVVQLRTYLTRDEDLATYFDMRNELYAATYPDRAFPTNTLLLVNGLYDKDLLLEIEAVAAV